MSPATASTYERFVKTPDTQQRMFGKIQAREVNKDLLEVEFVVSNFRRDDYGTRFDPNGVDLSQYLRNPLVSFGHMRDGGIYRLPVGRGKTDSIHVDKDGNLRMIVQFTPEATFEFGYQIYKLVRDGYLNMGSIAAEVHDEELIKEADGSSTLVFKKWKLYDFSIVPLGANDDALAIQRCKEMGMDRQSLIDIETGVTKRADGASDDEVQRVAHKLADEEAAVGGKKDNATPAPAAEGDDVQIDEESTDGERSKTIRMVVRKKDGTVLHRVYRELTVPAESADQKKYREFFEKNKEVLDEYRNLMKRTYNRNGLKQSEKESVAIRQLEELLKAPAPQKVIKRFAAEDLGVLVNALVPALANELRLTVQRGLPIKKLPEFSSELVKSVTRAVSISLSQNSHASNSAD